MLGFAKAESGTSIVEDILQHISYQKHNVFAYSADVICGQGLNRDFCGTCGSVLFNSVSEVSQSSRKFD